MSSAMTPKLPIASLLSSVGRISIARTQSPTITTACSAVGITNHRQISYRVHANNFGSNNQIACGNILLKHFSTSATIRPDPTHANIDNAPEDFDSSSAVVYPNFITVDEGKAFIKEASKRMKRRRFEQGHWDSVISLYREVELSTRLDFDIPSDHDNAANPDEELCISTIQRVRNHIAENHINATEEYRENEHSKPVKWLPCHAIDLHADGKLDAHVDSVKFSGGIVAGISLLSDSIMRLRPSDDEWEGNIDETDEKQWTKKSPTNNNDEKGHVDLFLPQFSLYVLSGMGRYSFTHELLPSESRFNFSTKNGGSENNVPSVNVARGRRLSIIFRDAHKNS